MDSWGPQSFEFAEMYLWCILVLVPSILTSSGTSVHICSSLHRRALCAACSAGEENMWNCWFPFKSMVLLCGTQGSSHSHFDGLLHLRSFQSGSISIYLNHIRGTPQKDGHLYYYFSRIWLSDWTFWISCHWNRGAWSFSIFRKSFATSRGRAHGGWGLRTAQLKMLLPSRKYNSSISPFIFPYAASTLNMYSISWVLGTHEPFWRFHVSIFISTMAGWFFNPQSSDLLMVFPKDVNFPRSMEPNGANIGTSQSIYYIKYYPILYSHDIPIIPPFPQHFQPPPEDVAGAEAERRR